MAVRSYFFDSVSGDRRYNSADLAAVLARLAVRDGVIFGYGNQLAVSPATGLAVQVATGAAWVQGRLVEVTAPETLSLAAADPSNPRIDRVVVRIDLNARTGSVAVKTGTPAASPAAPALTRDSTVWELSLARVQVPAGATSITSGNITDERGDTSVCGYAGFATLEPTGSGLVAQDSAYSSGVPGFTPASVKAALDALAGVRIKESGSNANGEYIRWENGLQICFAQFTHSNITPSTTSVQGITIYVDSAPYRTWTFPAAFLQKPSVLAGTDIIGTGLEGVWIDHDTATNMSIKYGLDSIVTFSQYVIGLVAIGRWK